MLEYPHLKVRIKPDEAKALLDALKTDASLVTGTLSLIGVTTDPKDDMIVACAVEGNADYVVSGDPHLLKLGRFESVRIISPAEFVGILNQLKND